LYHNSPFGGTAQREGDLLLFGRLILVLQMVYISNSSPFEGQGYSGGRGKISGDDGCPPCE